MVEVSGSLWSVPVDEQLEAARTLQAAGLRRLHWDMSDGQFASPGGFDAVRAQVITGATGLAAEAHVMAARPAGEVDAWTDFCDLVVVHVESDGWERAVDRVVQRGCTPGLAISPRTPVSAVPGDTAVLCMAVIPGTAGSAFDDGVLEKVAALRRLCPTRPTGIDGGVRRRHVEEATRAGAHWLVVGTDLFLGDGRSRWSDVLALQR